MSQELLIASIDRAGGHVVILAIVALVAVVGGLLYGLVHLGKSRARRSGADDGSGCPEA